MGARRKCPHLLHDTELFEFLDHSVCARLFGACNLPRTASRNGFLGAESIQVVSESVGDSPNGLFVPKRGSNLRNVMSNMPPRTLTAALRCLIQIRIVLLPLGERVSWTRRRFRRSRANTHP